MEQALAYLEQDPVLHTDMLEGVRRGSARVLQAEENGVLLYDTGSGAYLLSAKSEEAARRLLSAAERAELVVAHRKYGMEYAEKKFGLRARLQVCNAVYFGESPLPADENPAQIRVLDETFLPFVKEHYQSIDDEAYLRERLRSGETFGAFVRGEPAGFIGRHDDGAMGMLEVLPAYRRKGIARQLETFQANRLLREGRVPYAQIKAGNAVSAALHRGLGFRFSEYSICWLMR
ncbi:hypothetical protein CAFE_16640 [Caprobacter fermentans]|uniref:N-acetyltransferase domain-containing protein n=1 Tax=Caproicibacter fermentans TaxID=2576756 RepID=A0A6N8HYW6_9FIRM|nr:GNAT family N-acetyltransferase [Caproicibacter fermentans]MVB10962.1 hypothetical protein [Caproicibacter fermentans]OCN01663.1 hypothetical protein A7X67_00795 [Clostridium sp. W14A]